MRWRDDAEMKLFISGKEKSDKWSQEIFLDLLLMLKLPSGYLLKDKDMK